jgi:hypothetical protein
MKKRRFCARRYVTGPTGLLLVLLVVSCFPGAGGAELRADTSAGVAAGIEYTRSGNYKVRAFQNGQDMGIGLYDAGSFRLLPEGRPVVVIFNRVKEESWLYSRSSNTVESITRDRAVLFDNFMPASYLEPYFQLAGYWEGNEFKMVTDDGRVFRIRMDGPNNLPTLFEVSNSQGVFRSVVWTYFKVGEVSSKNFSPPEGATPKG